MRIVGLTGNKGAGKDATGRILEEQGFVRVGFGDALKDLCNQLWGISLLQLYDPLLKEVVIPRLGLSPRQVMQRFGTEVVRSVHKDTWVMRLVDQVQSGRVRVPLPSREDPLYFGFVDGDKFAVIDVRFHNEAQALRACDGQILRIVRPGCIVDDHQSETELGDILADGVIHNDGSLDDLRFKLKEVLWTLKSS